MWDNVIATQNDDAFFEDYVRLAIASTPPSLPERKLRLGAVRAEWFPTVPGTAHIVAEGGTPLDRRYAYKLIAAQLEGHGIIPATYSLDWDFADETIIKEAGWPDIQAKATRLIKDGKVKIVRNAREIVAGVVEGDHGTYNTEIQRNDPNSQSIAMWSCECKWDQFAWQRTRQWKRLEGRVCVMPGTLITLKTGEQIPIEEVQVDDLVLTHNGIGRVTQTMKNDYVGRIFSIYRFGFPDPLEITEDHEIWGMQTPDKVRNAKYNQGDLSRQGFKINDDSFLEQAPQWIDSQDLRVHDWVASTWAQSTPLGVGYHFATAFGYYLAEGNLAWQNDKLTEIQWTFHEDEADLHNHLIRALERLSNATARIYRNPVHTTVSIRITDHQLAKEFLTLGGHYARAKKLAPSVLRWPTQDLEALLEAHYQGDGTYNQKDARLTHYTASDELAQQLFDILVKCGYVPSWQRVTNNGGPQNREAVLSMNRIVYKRQKIGKGNGRRRFEDRYLSKITKIEEYEYEGPVYNLAVDNQESYVANGVVVHNCSHVLATYWQALATPFDEDVGPEQPGGEGAPAEMGPPAEQAQPSPFAQVPGGGTGAVPPAGAPGPQKPGAPNQVAPMPQPSPVPGQAPEPQSLIPQYPQDPALQPAINPVSVPGQKPQTPLNPIQNPGGTFSSYNGRNGTRSKAPTDRATNMEVCSDSEGWMLGMDRHQEQTDSSWKIFGQRQGSSSSSSDVRTFDRTDSERNGSSSPVRESLVRPARSSRTHNTKRQYSQRGQPGGNQYGQDSLQRGPSFRDRSSSSLSDLRQESSRGQAETISRSSITSGYARYAPYFMHEPTGQYFHYTAYFPETGVTPEQIRVSAQPHKERAQAWAERYKGGIKTKVYEDEIEIYNRHLDDADTLERILGGTFSHVSTVQFRNGEMVQLKQADHGQTVGLNAGETKEIPANSIGEVLGTDPLGLVNVYFAGPQAEAGRLEPHGVVMWAWPQDLIARPDVRPPGPATRRR